MKPLQAALQGTREVGFTVLSMSLSLVAVFLPLLLMGGLPGRLLREFAVTLCRHWYFAAGSDVNADDVRLDAKSQQAARAKATAWLWSHVGSPATRLWQVAEMGAQSYPSGGAWCCFGTIALNIWLYISIPKTFFPEQDTGVLMGGIQADQSISFQAMRGKLQDFMKNYP